MPRKKRPLDRDGGMFRDASLIVIASEDEYVVKDYFSRFRARRVQFIVVPTEDGRSAPAAVIARLDGFREEFEIKDDDQFWLCIDKDHWADSGHIANLVQVLQQCKQKEYQVAISNPCFELWLLLHFEGVEPTARLTCGQIVTRLKELAGGYSKKGCGGLGLDKTTVNNALERAKLLDTDESLIPDTLLTRVYQIISALQAKDAIELT